MRLGEIFLDILGITVQKLVMTNFLLWFTSILTSEIKIKTTCSFKKINLVFSSRGSIVIAFRNFVEVPTEAVRKFTGG